ncbi:uncharacterized protein [Lolium perenne]|uniref:uncharacterized protein n=1 Tax=Lolium perenne TaxID=4522 RepID=UPI003A99C9B3
MTGQLKQEKLSLTSHIDEAIAEVRPLTAQEIELKNQYNAKLAGLLREEELKWYQRSKAQFLLEGDANTIYFHSVANGRHRKKRIHSLVQEEGTIEGQEQLKSYITTYYKGLFGEPEESDLSMDESRTDDIPQVIPEENVILIAPYSEEEIRKAVFLMEHNKAPDKKGLRQGNPLSPMLFNIVADMLAIIIERAKFDGQIERVVPHLVDGGLSIFQYADDTILFMDHDLAKARNLKLILSAFEQLSGLKINFHKSYLEMYNHAAFMVTASTLRGPRPIYRGVYTIGEYDQGFYYPIWVAA